MATHYLYGTILTGEAVAANNRGDNIGNTTTLQKVFHQDDLHSSVSAEAIRFALRYWFQLQGLKVNRTYDPGKGKLDYKDEKRSYWTSSQGAYVDDDLMGFMDAVAAKQEREDEDSEEEDSVGTPRTRSRAKGTTTKWPSPLAVGRAVSLRPYRGEISFNAVSGEKTKGKLSLYAAEMHTTEYQYSFGLNLSDVIKKEHIGYLMDAIVDIPPVAGNHARFSYDFSPASIVLRLTTAHSSRIQNCFDHNPERRSYTVQRLINRVTSGDIQPEELIIGGEIYDTSEGQSLFELGVAIYPGIIKAAREARHRIALLGNAFKIVDPEAGNAQ